MIEIVVITPIPKSIETLVENSILRKALNKKIVKLSIVNLRDFGIGQYKKIDDKPYGGFHGMVLMAKPLSQAIDYSINLLGGEQQKIRIIYPSPQGKIWNQKIALSLLYMLVNILNTTFPLVLGHSGLGIIFLVSKCS